MRARARASRAAALQARSEDTTRVSVFVADLGVDGLGRLHPVTLPTRRGARASARRARARGKIQGSERAQCRAPLPRRPHLRRAAGWLL
jgi:hypothetical protein